MIDNNVDRMSVNILPFSLDRIVRSLEDQSVDKFFNIFIFNRINQDQLVVVRVRLRTDQPGFFCQFSKFEVQVMKFLISYRTSDIIWKD
jgi:hypothetical protein